MEKKYAKHGNIVLSPLKSNSNVNELFGMFNDGKLSSEDFIKEKAHEKEIVQIKRRQLVSRWA